MSVKLNLVYPHLQKLTDNQDIVEVNGSTLGQCLSDLVRQFPGIQKAMFDKDGKLLDYIALYINKESTYFDTEPLNKPIKDGDEILIALLIAGG